MPVNKYFSSNFSNNPSPESLLMEDLVIESIQIFGADVWYLPRTPLSSEDTLYGEQTSSYNASYTIDVYIATTEGYEGPSEYFSKFGLEIKDSFRVIVARRTFQKYVPNMSRPNEGDLIYLPQVTNLFEIKKVEEEQDFYSLGRRPPFFYYYEVTLELYKFNNERFNTGIPEIDRLGVDYSYTLHLTMNGGVGAGNYTIGENVYQGASYGTATASGVVKDWDRNAKILDIITIKGTFAQGTAVVGVTSSASYPISSFEGRDYQAVLEETSDNLEIQTEADAIVDFSTENPFGTPGA